METEGGADMRVGCCREQHSSWRRAEPLGSPELWESIAGIGHHGENLLLKLSSPLCMVTSSIYPPKPVLQLTKLLGHIEVRPGYLHDFT